MFTGGKLERWALSRTEQGGAPDRLLESAD